MADPLKVNKKAGRGDSVVKKSGSGNAGRLTWDEGRVAACRVCNAPTRRLRPQYRICQNGHEYMKKNGKRH